jgi:hypothetical protein
MSGARQVLSALLIVLLMPPPDTSRLSPAVGRNQCACKDMQ